MSIRGDIRGKAYLVGAGPGDPGLITLKAVEALKAADCVIYDFLANPRLLEYARPGAEKICVGKKGGAKTVSQGEINDLLVSKARRMTVARLKGGDPFIFGRGSEEAMRLAREGIPFEVIPGVTSASAVPAYAGIPLTHREFASSVSFVTGQEAPGKEDSDIAWDRLSHGDGTLVFLMGWKNLSMITAKLIALGRPPATPAAVISRGTFTRQRTVVATLDTIVREVERQGIKPPAVVVIGDVVGLRQELSWFETKPLFGKRIVVTRALEQSGSFAGMLEAKAAEPLIFPVIKTVLPLDHGPLDRAIKRLSTYDWAIFTSVNGVRYFVERLKRLEKDIRELKGVRLCAIGSMTAKAVEDLGMRVDLVPGEYRAEAIVSALGKKGIKGKRFVLPRAEKAREVLPLEIRRNGGAIDVVTAYRTVLPRKDAGWIRAELEAGLVDVVTFTSASTVANFAKALGKARVKALVKDCRIACIGPITRDAARECGMDVHIMPSEYTVKALADEIELYFRKTT